MLLLKEVLDHLRLFLPPMEMAPHRLDEFGAIGRTARAEPVGFDILVQEFIGIKFWTVARQTDQPESTGVPGDEPRHDGGTMHGMSVHNEIEPTANRLQ
jgi:hypothetical protein